MITAYKEGVSEDGKPDVKALQTRCPPDFWGVTDKESHRNNWPVTGRTITLLVDRNAQPKPAFDAMIRYSKVRIFSGSCAEPRVPHETTAL